MLYLISLVIVLIIVGYFLNKKRNKRIEQIKSNLLQLGYNTIEFYEFPNDIVSINTKANKIAVCPINSLSIDELNLSEIRDFDILKDGVTIFKKSTSASLGRAIVGGMLLGGVGAIIGGVTGKSKATEKINNSQIKLYTNNLAKPSVLILIFDKKQPQKLRKVFADRAQLFLDKLSILLDKEPVKNV